MPDNTPNVDVETQVKTRQTTRIIAGVLVALGIGAIIYFAAVGYLDQQKDKQALPLGFGDQYPAAMEVGGEEEVVISDPLEKEALNAKYNAIATNIAT